MTSKVLVNTLKIEGGGKSMIPENSKLKIENIIWSSDLRDGKITIKDRGREGIGGSIFSQLKEYLLKVQDVIVICALLYKVGEEYKFFSRAAIKLD